MRGRVVRSGVIGFVVMFLLAVVSIPGFAQTLRGARDPQEARAAIQYQVDLQHVTSNPQAVATDIVRRWEDAARDRGRWDVRFAEDLYHALLKLQPDNLLAANRAESFDDLMSVLATGRPAPTLKPDLIDTGIEPALGDLTADLVYNPVPPCRIVDTRYAVGFMAADTTRSFDVDGSSFAAQGGYAGSCGIPFGVARAVAMTVTVTAAGGFGWVTVWSYGAAQPLSSSLNYLTGWTVASSVTVPVVPGGGGDFYLRLGNAGAHVIVDVFGYYAAPVATALDCIEDYNVGTIAAGGSGYVDVSCPAGRTATGGAGDTFFAGTPAGVFLADRPYYNGWSTRVQNPTGSPLDVITKVRCCRIPGR